MAVFASEKHDDFAVVADARTEVRIISEQAHHVSARECLLDSQMGPRRRRKSSETLRRGRRPADGLAFAAVDGKGALVGTVRLWNVAAGIGQDGRPIPALLLGPLAVDSSIEGRGVGSMLIRHAIENARSLGHGAIILVGDAPYYGRFGFTSDFTGALAMPGPVERSRFLAIELVANHLSGAAGVLVATGQLASARRRFRQAA